MASASIHCAECGAVIPDTTLGAVCPSCLLGGLWGDEPVPQPGALFSVPGHEVVSELGRGGMGIVYLARQHDPPREVALKMLLPAQGLSPEMRERLRMEAATVAALDHPHILPVYATGEYDGLPWFTMKLARGGSLAERSASYSDRWRSIAELIITLAEAVHFAHQRGVLHRDLKPANVIFDDAANAYITDFGLAKWVGEESHALTREGTTMGTPHYLTPEVAQRGAAAATAASDVYGLGTMLYELLTGQPPFTAPSTPELLRRIYSDPVAPPSRVRNEVPRDLSAVAVKCLEKEPAQRYESAKALAADLRSWLAGRGVKARPVRPVVRVWRWARRNPALALTAAALLAVLITAGILQVRANRRLSTALAESLLSQARMTAGGSAQGTRDAALQLLREADEHGVRDMPQLAVQRRSEIARTLALPELAAMHSWLAPSPSSMGEEGFSPDLSRYLAATPDGGFALYDSASRAVLQSWPPPPEEQAARLRSPALRTRLSPDGKLAAVIFAGDASAPAALRVIALPDGKTLGEWPCPYDSREWPLWLPDGGFIYGSILTPAVRADAGGKNVRPWPDAARTGRPLPRALNPDRSLAAILLQEATALAAVRVADGQEIWRTVLHDLPRSVAWSPDGSLIAAGETASASAPDEKAAQRSGFGILCFAAADGAFLRELPGHKVPVAYVTFLHGARSVVSIAVDQGMVWQETAPGGFRLNAQAQPRVLQTDSTATKLAWSPAQGSLATATAVLPAGWHIWPESAGGTVTCTVMSDDSTRFFLTTKEHLEIRDAATGRRLHRRPWPPGFYKLWPWFVVTPDGSQMIIGDEGQPLHTVAVKPAADGTPLADTEPPQPRGTGYYMVHSLTTSGGWVVCNGPAGRTVQRGRTYEIWPQGDPAQARVVARDISASTMHVAGADGRWALATARNGRDCTIYDLRAAEGERPPFTAGIDDAVIPTLSPDRRYASLAGRQRVALWDSTTQRLAANWPAPPGTGGTGSKFSTDGRFLAIHDHSGAIHIFTVPDGKAWATLHIPGDFPLWDLHWSGPQRMICVASDGRIGSWDLEETAQAAQQEGLAE